MEERRRPGRPATGKTPQHTVRMDDDRWQRFGDATERAGTDRTSVVNNFAAWYASEDGAELPDRPGTGTRIGNAGDRFELDGETYLVTGRIDDRDVYLCERQSDDQKVEVAWETVEDEGTWQE